MKTLLQKMSLTQLRMFMFAHRLIFSFAVMLTLLVGMSAFAQDAGTTVTTVAAAPAATAAAPAQLTTDITTVETAAQSIIKMAQDPTSPKFLLVIAVLVALTRLFKYFSPRIPGVGTWFTTHPWGDWAATALISVGGALLTSFPAGTPVTLGLVLSALVAGMVGSGLPLGGNNAPAAPAPSIAPAVAAGTAGAADPGKNLNS